MRLKGNETGVALGVVMIFSVIGLVIAAGVLYMTARWAGIAAMERSYKTAHEAAVGGTGITFSYIAGRGVPAADNVIVTTSLPATDNCVIDKMTRPTSAWGAGCNSSPIIDPLNTATFDLQFDLGSYRVYSKIVDTIQGNSAASLGLETASSVANTGSGEVQVLQMPYLYTIEILSQRASNPGERSRVSVLYQY